MRCWVGGVRLSGGPKNDTSTEKRQKITRTKGNMRHRDAGGGMGRGGATEGGSGDTDESFQTSVVKR